MMFSQNNNCAPLIHVYERAILVTLQATSSHGTDSFVLSTCLTRKSNKKSACHKALPKVIMHIDKMIHVYSVYIKLKLTIKIKPLLN